MARSEAAKALEAKQKADARAEKLRKKTSDDPRDWNRFRQITSAYKATSEYDPKLNLIMAGCLFVPLVLFSGLGVLMFALWHMPWFNLVLMILLGVMGGIYACLLMLQRRAKIATFTRYEGQAGSGEIALQMLPKEWSAKPVVAYTKYKDVVHRALGPGGLLLIGEGEPGRVKALLATEAKKCEQVLFNVTPQTLVIGTQPGQVKLADLPKFIKKLPKTMDASQIAEAAKRLAALDAHKQIAPLPKGPLPTRGARSAMRGR